MPQNSPPRPKMTAAQIDMQKQAAMQKMVAMTELWGKAVVEQFIEKSTSFNVDLIGPWEDTPKWMFWKPTKRRLIIPPRPGGPLYEYQHPAFVAREALERYCAPRNFTGTGLNAAQQASNPHRARHQVDGLRGYRLDSSDLIRTA